MDLHFNKMCRICLREEESMRSIFRSSDLDGVSLPSKIMACTTVQVLVDDGLPHSICSKCLHQVDVAYEFRETCQSTDATLKKYISLVTSTIQKTEDYNEDSKIGLLHKLEDTVKEELSSSIYEYDKESSVLSVDESKLNDSSESDVPLVSKQLSVKRSKKKDKKVKAVQGKVEETEERREKEFECPICHKAFAYMCILKDHMVQHTGDKPYLCSACGKSFGHTASLTNHMKTHYSDKPHKCNHCELSFHRRTHLILHLRTHTGEKPFVCEICGRDFAQGSYLKEHMRVHSGEKPFVCDVCGHGFARKSCLVMHRRVHTGELPYVCPECGRAFSQRSQRKRHVKRNHKGSACLRNTGELILKDLDVKNTVPTDVVDQVATMEPSPSNAQFIYTQDSTLATTMSLPLPMQIHRTLLQ